MVLRHLLVNSYNIFVLHHLLLQQHSSSKWSAALQQHSSSKWCNTKIFTPAMSIAVHRQEPRDMG